MTVPLAEPYVLERGGTRRECDACRSRRRQWTARRIAQHLRIRVEAGESGPVLHMHTDIDEAFFVSRGSLEAQLGEDRVAIGEGVISVGSSGHCTYLRQCRS